MITRKYPPRRSLRIPGYDYSSAGGYFITLSAHRSKPLFGAIANSEMCLNQFGEIVTEEWKRSFAIREEISPDAWVVMPNHFHAIVLFTKAGNDCTGDQPVARTTRPCGPATHSLSSLVAGFKAAATKRINAHRHTPGAPVWHRNYYEHVIRDEKSLDRIREYIFYNPLRWDLDRENPKARGEDEFDQWLSRFTVPPRTGDRPVARTSDSVNKRGEKGV